MPAAFLPHKTMNSASMSRPHVSLTPISQEGGLSSWRRFPMFHLHSIISPSVHPSFLPSHVRSSLPDGVYGVSALRFGFPFLAALVAESRRECAE